VGAFDLKTARTLAELEADFTVTSLDEVAATAFVRRDLTADEALSLSHGGKLTTSDLGDEPVAAFGPDGEVVALLEDRDGVARALVVFVG
jgi:tRNA pseudouridine55 synthase